MGRKRTLAAVVIVIAAVLAYAWINGGSVPQRMIEQTVALPEGAR